MKIVLRIRRCSEGDGYEAWCPALPGCTARGGTQEHARDRLKEAVKGYLASLDVAVPRDIDDAFHSRNPGGARMADRPADPDRRATEQTSHDGETMNECPYLNGPCSAYLDEARELSAGLAERIEGVYCRGHFSTCSRYRAARNVRLSSQPNLAPWSNRTCGRANRTPAPRVRRAVRRQESRRAPRCR